MVYFPIHYKSIYSVDMTPKTHMKKFSIGVTSMLKSIHGRA